MSRLFQRGELKAAVLEIVAERGPVHGYAVLGALSEQIGGAWRPSPGAVYPALVALEDAGLIVGEDGAEARSYSVTPAGRSAIDRREPVLAEVARRSAGRVAAPTLGSLVDRFAAELPGRSTRLDASAHADAAALLDRTEAAMRDLIARADPMNKEHERHG